MYFNFYGPTMMAGPDADIGVDQLVHDSLTALSVPSAHIMSNAVAFEVVTPDSKVITP